jgi:hypothetical protein
MASKGRMNEATLIAQIERFLNCKDHKEFDRIKAQAYLLQQLFVLHPDQEQAKKSPLEQLNFISSFGPRQVCQYQVWH